MQILPEVGRVQLQALSPLQKLSIPAAAVAGYPNFLGGLNLWGEVTERRE